MFNPWRKTPWRASLFYLESATRVQKFSRYNEAHSLVEYPVESVTQASGGVTTVISVIEHSFEAIFQLRQRHEVHTESRCLHLSKPCLTIIQLSSSPWLSWRKPKIIAGKPVYIEEGIHDTCPNPFRKTPDCRRRYFGSVEKGPLGC